MKKIVCFALALVFVLALGSCAADIHKKSEGVLTHAQYLGTEDSKEVVVETFVQDKQSWWDNKATVYTQDKDGAYFLYNMPCTEEEYDKLVPGTRIIVSGYKAEWSGEIEIIDAAYQIMDGSKRPGRDKIIAIAIACEMTLPECQRALEIAREGILYAKSRRDSLIIYSINKKMNIMELNVLLEEYGLPLLK